MLKKPFLLYMALFPLPFCMSQEAAEVSAAFSAETAAVEAAMAADAAAVKAAMAAEAAAVEAAMPSGTAAAPVKAGAAAETPAEISAETIAAVLDDAPELDIETLLRRRITESAQEYLGVPYKYAAAGPEGFDCTGLIHFVYREAAGMAVSRSTAGLWNSGKKITLAQVLPGDVLIFTTVRPGASHAGIVLENGPEGIIFIHAASQGSKTGVIISNMNEAYYKTRFMGARNYF